MVIFNQATRPSAPSQPEPEGPPPRFPGMADGPVSWGGARWFAFPLSMLTGRDADARQQIMLHGLFHRLQPELEFTRAFLVHFPGLVERSIESMPRLFRFVKS